MMGIWKGDKVFKDIDKKKESPVRQGKLTLPYSVNDTLKKKGDLAVGHL